MVETSKCTGCGEMLPTLLLDGKPASAHFQRDRAEHGQVAALAMAADRGEDFTRAECAACYGPGYVNPMEAVRHG
ncbi:hypothetical protein [Microcystis phage Mwe-JY25]